MKRHWLLTALGAILAGAGLHFLWQAPVSYTHLTLPTKA